jgi:transposase
MTLLCRLRGADRHVVRRRLLRSVERAGMAIREISQELPVAAPAYERS